MDTIPGFRYVDGRLTASGVPLERALAAVGSCWVYDAATFDARATALVKAFDPSWARPCYAVKANTNPALLARARKHGLGAEVSSGGELKLALDSGFDPAKLVLNGNGKTSSELAYAIQSGIGFVSVKAFDAVKLQSFLWAKHRIWTTAVVTPGEYEVLRVTPNVYTTLEEIDTFADVMEKVIRAGSIPS